MSIYQAAIRPHVFAPGEQWVDLYHVYDNLSQTPYIPGHGICCGDPDEYFMDPVYVLTPEALLRHADWGNRIPTQFISFFDNQDDALQEARRRTHQRYVPGGGVRDPASVHIAHVRLHPGMNVWAFSRLEMLDMVRSFGNDGQAREMHQRSHPREWYVWGGVPEGNVLAIVP